MKTEDTKTICEDKEQRLSIWEVLIGIVKKKIIFLKRGSQANLEMHQL